MVNKQGKELFELVGTVTRKYPAEFGKTKFGKSYTKNKFSFHLVDGRDVYVTTFGKFSEDYLGKDIKFNASKYNETNYTLEGEIVSASQEVEKVVNSVPTPVAVAPEVATKRRGRPSAKVTTAPALVPTVVTNHTPSESVPTGRELYRGEAEAGAKTNLESARRVLAELGLTGQGTIADLVAVADLIGRTQTAIFMDAQKDNRMAKFSR